MNGILRKSALISGILLALGIVSMVVGIQLGGQLNYVFNLQNHKVYVPTDEEMQYVDETVAVEAFDSIDVEFDSVDVEVRQGESYQVQYHLTAWDEPVIKVKSNKLVVRNKEDNVAAFGWSFGLFGLRIGSPLEEEQKKIVVTIPKDVKLDNMKVYSEYGNVNTSDLQMESFDIKADSGDVLLENIETENGMIVAEFGNVVVSNMTGEKSIITANSGDCSLDAVQSNKLNVTAEYGKVKLNEIEAEELVVKAASGDVSFANVSANIVDVVAEYGEVIINVLDGDTCTIEAQSGKCELDTIQLVNLTVKAEYGDVSVENAIMENMNIVCESGDCDVDLIGSVEEYDMDITVNAGNLEINGEKQGNKYKSTVKKEKSIVILSEYGDVNIQIRE